MNLQDTTSQLDTSRFTSALLEWWQTNKRDFAWRNSHNPYEILIAELFLRRTNAPAAQGVYLDFIRKYPSVESLGGGTADEIESIVLRLGLNWRARNVVELANHFRAGNDIPPSMEELLELPGVGPYVARAVLVNCHQVHTTPVDSNVLRVICRYLGLTNNDNLRRKKEFQELADKFCANVPPKDFNFALLDFSSLICAPRAPKCKICPVAQSCCYADKRC